jgi:hypothetical protein
VCCSTCAGGLAGCGRAAICCRLPCGPALKAAALTTRGWCRSVLGLHGTLGCSQGLTTARVAESLRCAGIWLCVKWVCVLFCCTLCVQDGPAAYGITCRRRHRAARRRAQRQHNQVILLLDSCGTAACSGPDSGSAQQQLHAGIGLHVRLRTVRGPAVGAGRQQTLTLHIARSGALRTQRCCIASAPGCGSAVSRMEGCVHNATCI